jgi:hypothetical protein
MVCSDCGSSYFAEIVESGGSYSIGDKVPEPPEGTPCRTQRMVCGDCRGKGGAGSQLQKMIEQQRAMMAELGL